MAGILANSLSHQMVDGDTSPVNVVAGYVSGQVVTLSVTPTGSTYQWTLSNPSTSSRTRPPALSDIQGATPTFTPDVGGFYILTCLVDGVTSYTLTLDVLDVAQPVNIPALLGQEVSESAVASPPGAALTVFKSKEQGIHVTKDSAGAVVALGAGSWASFSATVTFDVDPFALGNGSISTWWKRAGDELWIKLGFEQGSTTTPDWTTITIEFPTAAGALVADGTKLVLTEETFYTYAIAGSTGGAGLAATGTPTSVLMILPVALTSGQILIAEVHVPVKAAP
jgi:hypothetical protein